MQVTTLLARQAGDTASVPLQPGMTFERTVSGGALIGGTGTAQIGFSAESVGTLQLSCRAGTTTDWYFGNEASNENVALYAWRASPTSQPVGLLKTNAFGLYDMVGNVPQRCADIQ